MRALVEWLQSEGMFVTGFAEEASFLPCGLVAVSGSFAGTIVDSWCFSSWETFGCPVNKTWKRGRNTEGQWSSLLLQMKNGCHKIYSTESAAVQVGTMLSALWYKSCLYLTSKHFLKLKIHLVYSDQCFPCRFLPEPPYLPIQLYDLFSL